MIYILFIIAAIIMVSVILFLFETNNAITVDEKEPFLRGDYDPDKDPNAPKHLNVY